MKRTLLSVSAVGLAAAVVLAGKPDVKPSVTYAKSWDAAVKEARLLNVPIVLHSHGFN
ncbi:MAG: hypothetical protein ACE5JG_08060 [Planctomycetota bacterium]